MFPEDERIETQAGSLQPVVGVHGLGALLCEIIERIEKQPGGPYPGEVIATGADTLINDFAAIVSFALNIACTTDLDLVRRLVANERVGAVRRSRRSTWSGESTGICASPSARPLNPRVAVLGYHGLPRSADLTSVLNTAISAKIATPKLGT
jgi:hypothetical protein